MSASEEHDAPDTQAEPSELSFEERRLVFERSSTSGELSARGVNSLGDSSHGDTTNHVGTTEANDIDVDDRANQNEAEKKSSGIVEANDMDAEDRENQNETETKSSDAELLGINSNALHTGESHADFSTSTVPLGTGMVLETSDIAVENNKVATLDVEIEEQSRTDSTAAPSKMPDAESKENVGDNSQEDPDNSLLKEARTNVLETFTTQEIIQAETCLEKTAIAQMDGELDMTFGNIPTSLQKSKAISEEVGSTSVIPEEDSDWPTQSHDGHPSCSSALGFEDDPDSEDEYQRPQRPTLLHEIAERARQAASGNENSDSVMTPCRKEHRTEASHASVPPAFGYNSEHPDSTKHVEDDRLPINMLMKSPIESQESNISIDDSLQTIVREFSSRGNQKVIEEWLPLEPDALATVPFSNDDDLDMSFGGKKFTSMHNDGSFVANCIDEKVSVISEISLKQVEPIVEPAVAPGVGVSADAELLVSEISSRQVEPGVAPEETTKPISADVELLPDNNDGTYEDLDLEELENQLIKREAELKQMRADFQVRAKRSSDLRNALQAHGGAGGTQTTATLRRSIIDARDRLQTNGVRRDRAAMKTEDFLEGGRRLLLARDNEISFLERKMHSMQQKHQRLVHSREPVSDDIAKEVLKEKRKQFVALEADKEAQESKISSLGADLKNVLDFMMRVNIEALGGPARHLTSEDFLPQDVREHLQFTKYTQAVLKDLVHKYELCMAQCKEKTASSSADPHNHKLGQAEEKSSTVPSDQGGGNWMQGMGSLDTLPLQESKTSSFGQEAKLLRKRFADEMQRVASALADEDGSVLNSTRETMITHEILRAAAWGDETTLRELLPLSERSLEHWHKSGDDSALLGWTPWHAAAAHGQAATLDVLREMTLTQGGQNQKAQGQLTMSGLPPLAVACLRGHVEVVRSLLAGMAPIHLHDTRGNSPLHWAAAFGTGKSSQSTHQLLIKAKCNANARNHSGQFATLSFSLTKGSDSDTPEDQGLMNKSMEPSQSAESSGEPYCIIEAVGLHHSEDQKGFLQSAFSMLKVSVRDEVGFVRNDRAKVLANLNPHETESGVFSDWIINYTHAGLREATGFEQPDASPIWEENNQQAAVLTTERLLLFNVANWSLVITLQLVDLIEVVISPQSKSLLLIRANRRADVLIDIVNRSRFFDELQIVAKQLPKRYRNGAADEFRIPVRTTPDILLTLSNERKQPLGTCGFLEANVFLFLPYVPSSILLAGPMPTFFGFLDLQRTIQAEPGFGAQWRWQKQFFVLKIGLADQRMLLWCNSPTDSEASGHAVIDQIFKVQSINSMQGEPCIVIEYATDPSTSTPQSITLRAKTVRNRDEWASCLKALWGNTRKT